MCECYETIKNSISETWKKFVYTNEKYHKMKIEHDCPFYELKQNNMTIFQNSSC